MIPDDDILTRPLELEEVRDLRESVSLGDSIAVRSTLPPETDSYVMAAYTLYRVAVRRGLAPPPADGEDRADAVSTFSDRIRLADLEAVLDGTRSPEDPTSASSDDGRE